MVTVKYGSRGEAVKIVQNAVSVKADGIFGSKTETAVKQFQKEHGLTADGIVGRKTWAAIGYTEADITIPCDDLKQGAAPHGSMIYGADKTYSTYAQGGCGVVSFAIVYRALGLAPEGETGTETIQRLGRYSWEHGYRIKGGGTKATLFNTNGCKRCRVTKAGIETAIRSGKLVILHIGAGFKNGYGGNGHYIVAYGLSGDYLLLRDVGSSKASRQKVLLSSVGTGLKNAWEVTRE